MIHFVHRQVWDTLVILKEGNHPHPQCLDCDIFVPWVAFNRYHLTTYLCERGAEQRYRKLTEYEARGGVGTGLNGVPPSPGDVVLLPSHGDNNNSNGQ